MVLAEHQVNQVLVDYQEQAERQVSQDYQEQAELQVRVVLVD